LGKNIITSKDFQRSGYVTFGERLKKLREEKSMRQEDLANLINVHRATIGKYETNERSPDKDTIILLSDLFNVTTDFLLGRVFKKSSAIYEDQIQYQVNNSGYDVKRNNVKLPIQAKIALKEFEDFLIKKYEVRE
jgi:transcriptional regulator with XRE-family HTH domain